MLDRVFAIPYLIVRNKIAGGLNADNPDQQRADNIAQVLAG